MSEVVAFGGLGFRHITDLAAVDHLLFLIALVATYRWRDWRHLLVVASAFTLGHSVTLGLAVAEVVRWPTATIEFLIPVTIVGAGLANLRPAGGPPTGRLRPVLAGGFGLIHGAGFANFLREIVPGSLGTPLLAFNLGIEAGQLAILAIALTALAALDRLAARWTSRTACRGPTVATSLVAVSWAAWMAVHRTPW